MLNEKINGSEFLETSRKKSNYFTRKRNLRFPTLCLFLLETVRECLSVAFLKFTNKIEEDISMTQQSLSDARDKIRWEAFEELSQDTGDLAYTGYYETWEGYRLWAVDGTKLALPNVPSLRKLFGDEKGSPTAQGSILYDVLNYTVFDAHIEPLAVDERTLAKRHIDAIAKRLHGGRDLIIFDRGYPSEELIDCLETKNIKYLMRVRRKFNTSIDAITGNEGFVQIGRHTVRVIKVVLDTGEVETLLTNLEEDFDFKKLYYCRWGVETEYDVLKNTLEIENFSGRTETAIRQDFYAHIIASNLLAASYWEAQDIVDKTRNANAENTHQYKVNVSQAAGILKIYLVMAILAETDEQRERILTQMHKRIAKASVPVRLGRSVTRKKNNRRSKFAHNRKSNL